jgi:ketosteroid isomerase-like protein
LRTRDTARGMSQARVDLLRTAYEALSRRDIDGWLAAIRPDAEMRDFTAEPGVYRGHGELRAWMESGLEVSSSWELTPHEFIEGPQGRLFVRVRVIATSAGAGVPVAGVVYNVFEFAGTSVASIANFLDEAEALEAAGLSE